MKRAALSLLLTALALPLLARPAAAGDPVAPASSDDASKHYRAGVDFYKAHDFAAALTEFKRAYELSPNFKVLFNLGQASQELNDYASALTAFRRYLAEGGTGIEKNRRKEVEGYIAALELKVAEVTFELNVEGAELTIDDAPIGTAPLSQAVLVNPGRRKFGATKEGYDPVYRQQEVVGRDQVVIKLELVKKGQPVIVTPPPPVVKEEPARPIAIGVWAMLGATGAVGIGTAIVGGLAVSARSDLDDALATVPGDRTAITDAQDKTRTLALATDVLIGVTAAAAAATVVWLVVDRVMGGPSDTSAPANSGRVRVTPFGLDATF
ncbi:MAG: tetratricopeptide repeat protein [Polyangiaceae bacterium]